MRKSWSRVRKLALAAGLVVLGAGALRLAGDVVRPAAAEGDAAAAAVETPAVSLPPPVAPRITALGRIEPRGGVIRVAGPSRPAVVIAKLLVAEGDPVEEGQPLAILDSHALSQAEVARLEAELGGAERDLKRVKSLYGDGVTSDAKRDEALTRAQVARANLARARAELELAVVRAPISGRVLEVHARTGERVGPEGILELGQTAEMIAVAEVYETDIGRVRPEQRAIVRSQALAEPLHGTVERIGRKVGKMDVLGTDPAAKTDARVVEVDIRLEDGAPVAGLTNLQVEVEVLP